MALGFSYRGQLQAEWESARGYLVAQFDELYAALATLSPLTDNVKLPYKDSATLLTTSRGLPSLHQQVRAAVYNSVVQAIADVTLTNLTFNSAVFDVGGMWNPAFPTRLTVPPVDGEGTYLVMAVCPFAANAANQRQIRINKNGTTQLPFVNVPAAAAFVQTPTVSQLLPALGGDYFEIQVYQDSGGPLNTATRPQLSAIKLAAA